MKKLLLLCSLVSVLFATETLAQIPEILSDKPMSVSIEEHTGCAHSKHVANSLMARTSAIKRKNYDVLSYKLFMDWRICFSEDSTPSGRAYWAKNDITIRIDSLTNMISLNARDLRIDSVFVDGVKNANFTQPSGGNFSITFAQQMQPKTQMLLSVYYTQISTEPTFNGFARFKKGVYQGGEAVEDICYTMSQPYDARRWMPCNDEPYDKAIASISVRVPTGITVASNGLLQRIEDHSDASQTFHWADTVPIPPYLMEAAASRFKVYTEWYKRRNNPNDSIPVPFYVWKVDYDATATDGSEFNARWAQRNTVKMMEVFSDLYSEYPFDKYGTVSLSPFFNGGMEHQTITTNSRNALRGSWENVIAHELMHQWTGDAVTCATWNDLWLNEGGASYGEALWVESQQGTQAYIDYLRRTRDRSYFRADGAQSQPAIYNNGTNIFNGGTTYIKGSWIYHMMRKMIGDSAYFSFMKEYMRRYKFQSLETIDFQKLLEEFVPNPPVAWETFFEQWIFTPGHPIYSSQLMSITSQGSNNTIKLLLQQIQEQPFAQVYSMPVTITFFNRDSSQRFNYTVLNNQRVQEVEASVPFLPSTYVVESVDNVLCQRVEQSVVVSVASAEAPQALLVVSPNPAPQNGTVSINYSHAHAGHVNIELVNVLGEQVRLVHNGEMPSGNFSAVLTTNNLAAGVYYVRMIGASGEFETAKVVVE